MTTGKLRTITTNFHNSRWFRITFGSAASGRAQEASVWPNACDLALGMGGRTMMYVMPKQMYPHYNGLGHNLHSKTWWFRRFCNSHQVSYFTAFFIDTRAKISIAESYFSFDAYPIPEVPIINGALKDEQCFECSLMLFMLGFVRP